MPSNEFLSTVPLFLGLSDAQHHALGNIAVERSFKSGHTIFSEGDEAAGFYVVVAGQVRVFKLGSDGKEQTLHIFTTGAPFGEVPVFAGQKFPAHAAALRDSRVWFFPKAAFIALVRKDPSLALNMLAVLSVRLRKFAGLIESLSLKEVPGRLAAYLLHLAEQQGGDVVELDMPKAQLATVLGTIPETLSRVLTRLANEGGVEQMGGRKIRLANPEYLAKLGSGESRLR